MPRDEVAAIFRAPKKMTHQQLHTSEQIEKPRAERHLHGCEKRRAHQQGNKFKVERRLKRGHGFPRIVEQEMLHCQCRGNLGHRRRVVVPPIDPQQHSRNQCAPPKQPLAKQFSVNEGARHFEQGKPQPLGLQPALPQQPHQAKASHKERAEKHTPHRQRPQPRPPRHSRTTFKRPDGRSLIRPARH